MRKLLVLFLLTLALGVLAGSALAENGGILPQTTQKVGFVIS